MQVFGPYTRKDNRKHIIIIHDNGRRQTKSYARYIMEQYLGRELTIHETIDHINNDKTDDRLENLQILSRADNARKAMEIKPKQMYRFNCPHCGKECIKELRFVAGNWRKGRSGPYCSRYCAGKHTAVN